jgi:hypothetical protein
MEKFSIGRTFSRAWGLAGATLPTVGGFMLILYIVSGTLNFLLQGPMTASILAAQQQGSDPRMAGLVLFRTPWYWLMMLVSLVIGAVGFAGAIQGMSSVARGGATSIGECFARGFARALPALGLLILWGLGVWLGMILLVVPGVILICMWSVSVPVLMAENAGIFASFGRSRALTKGSRWPILGLLLIVLIAFYLISLVLGAVGLFSLGMSRYAAPAAFSPVLMIGMMVISAVFGLLLNALLVSIYAETLVAKGDSLDGGIAEVFA